MASLDEELRTELITAATTAVIGNRCHQNVIPQRGGNTFPRVWYQRIGREEQVDLDGTRGGLMSSRYDVECHSTAIDQAIDVADSIRTALSGKYGTFGGASVKGCFVEDHDDTYIPRGIGDDHGVHVSALQLVIWST